MSAAADEPDIDQTRKLGELVRSTRVELGWSSDDVTRETGISESGLYLIERGERVRKGVVSPYEVRTATLVKLAQALGITAAELESAERPDAAVALLAPHLALAGVLDDAATRRLITDLRTVLNTLGHYGSLVEWVAVAAGVLHPPITRRAELAARADVGTDATGDAGATTVG